MSAAQRTPPTNQHIKLVVEERAVMKLQKQIRTKTNNKNRKRRGEKKKRVRKGGGKEKIKKNRQCVPRNEKKRKVKKTKRKKNKEEKNENEKKMWIKKSCCRAMLKNILTFSLTIFSVDPVLSLQSCKEVKKHEKKRTERHKGKEE